MAIRIIEGVPGSGKTYYAVRHVAKTFFTKKKDGSYVLTKPCTLITNIDSFQPDHISLQDEIKKAGGVEHFFSYDYQEKFKEGKDRIVYIIDEAQRFFRKGNRKLTDVYTYFEYHRHWGQDIYLVTQNARKLPPDIVYLTEYIIVAAPRTRSILGEFKYKWISDGEILKREGFKPDQGVFALYKSMDVEESEKIKNPIMKTVYLTFGIVALVVFGGYKYFTSQWAQPTIKPQEVSTSANPKKSTVPINVGQGSAQAKPVHVPVSYEILVPLNTVSLFTEVKSRVRVNIAVPWRGSLLPLDRFPYPIERHGRTWFVVLEQSIFQFLFPDEDSRPQNVFVRQKKAAAEGAT